MGSHDHIGEVPMFPLTNFYAPTGAGPAQRLDVLLPGALSWCAQRLISLNLKAAQSLMEGQSGKPSRPWPGPRDLQSWNEAQATLTEHFIDQVISYAGDFNEVVAANQHELAELLNLHAAKPQATPSSMLTAGPGDHRWDGPQHARRGHQVPRCDAGHGQAGGCQSAGKAGPQTLLITPCDARQVSPRTSLANFSCYQLFRI